MKALDAVLWTTVCAGWLTHTVLSTVEEDEVQCQPQHVHLSLGEAPDQMAVMWATKGACSAAVAYGTSPWRLDQQVKGTSQDYLEHNQQGLRVLHKALLTGLKENLTYFYRPSSNDIGSGPFFFQTPPNEKTGWSPELLVVGHLGPHSELLPLLSQASLTGQYSAALQLGGLSTYFSDANGTRGDLLMKGLEQVAAFLPYMTSPGDNETEDGQFPGYRHRFTMPGSMWPIPVDKLWYSFNIGLVHFVSYCTDIYFYDNPALKEKQRTWLTKDLSDANQVRDTWPWIIAFGYHPMYCTSDHNSDCSRNNSVVRTELEEIMYHYGVDLILHSHMHSYERMYPLFKEVVLSSNYTNPRAPVHIVVGTAAATKPPLATSTTTEVSTNGSDSNITNTTEKGRITDLGISALKLNGTLPTYGRLHIINNTHAHWRLLYGEKEGEMADELWLVQEHHGKFQLADLPKEVEEKIDQNLVAGGGKPGVLNVNDPETDMKNMLVTDDKRRIIIGSSFGAAILLIVVILVACKLQGRRKRRVARRWDSMDYKYGKTKLYTPTHDEEDEDDFRDDNDFEVDIPDSGQQTTKLINGK